MCAIFLAPRVRAPNELETPMTFLTRRLLAPIFALALLLGASSAHAETSR